MICAAKPEAKQPLNALHDLTKVLLGQVSACLQLAPEATHTTTNYASKQISNLLDRLHVLGPHLTPQGMRKAIEQIVGLIKEIGKGPATPEQQQALEDACKELSRLAEEAGTLPQLTHLKLAAAAGRLTTVVRELGRALGAAPPSAELNAKKDELRTAILALNEEVTTAFPQREEVPTGAGVSGLGRLPEMRNGRPVAHLVEEIFPSQP